MPQLDVNAFLPILFCLLLCYVTVFLVIYLFLFLPLINYRKLQLVWQQKQLFSVYLLYVYVIRISSYSYTQKLLSLTQNSNLYSFSPSNGVKANHRN